MAFDGIVDQPRAVELLRRALEGGRVAHAYAFIGPAGSGRTSCALAFARALLCENGGCGQCRACALVASRQHPDLHVIVPTPPEKNPRGPRAIRIEAIRELARQAALTPALGRFKVFVLDDAERMTGESPEAFLKVLEEPPAHTVMLLILPRARAVPATVLSRCQRVRFEPRPDEARAARRRDARALLEEVRAGGVGAMFKRADKLDRERAEELVDAYWMLCRDLLVLKAGGPLALVGESERAEDLVREAEAWSFDELLATVDLCRDARRALAVNVAPRLTLEIVLSRLALRAA